MSKNTKRGKKITQKEKEDKKKKGKDKKKKKTQDRHGGKCQNYNHQSTKKCFTIYKYTYLQRLTY